MKLHRLIVLLLVFVSTFACATKPPVQESARFIVAFKNTQLFEQALQEKASVIQQWESATSANIEFVRTLSGHSWVVSVTAPAKSTFIRDLQALDNIKYVEEDQVIQISPIERPTGSNVRVF